VVFAQNGCPPKDKKGRITKESVATETLSVSSRRFWVAMILFLSAAILVRVSK